MGVAWYARGSGSVHLGRHQLQGAASDADAGGDHAVAFRLVTGHSGRFITPYSPNDASLLAATGVLLQVISVLVLIPTGERSATGRWSSVIAAPTGCLCGSSVIHRT